MFRYPVFPSLWVAVRARARARARGFVGWNMVQRWVLRWDHALRSIVRGRFVVNHGVPSLSRTRRTDCMTAASSQERIRTLVNGIRQ